MLYRLGLWGRGVIHQSKMTKEERPANHTCLEKTQLNNIWVCFQHLGHRKDTGLDGANLWEPTNLLFNTCYVQQSKGRIDIF
jgi:hypothetical protein